MITDKLLTLMISPILAFFMLLPPADSTVIAKMNSVMNYWLEKLGVFNFIFPFDVLFHVLFLVFSIEVTILSIKGIFFRARQISLGLFKG